MRGLFTVIVALFVMSSPAYAQLARNQVFGVEADHDGVDTDYYDVKIDGALVKTLTTAQALTGTVARVGGLVAPATAGSHTITMTARNVDGGSAESDPLAFTVLKGQPAKPGKPRINTGLTAVVRKLFGIPRDEVEEDPAPLKIAIKRK